MWNKIKSWLGQRTTQVGIATAIITMVTVFAPEHATLVAGVFAAFGLIVPDRKTAKAPPGVLLMLTLVAGIWFVPACGASVGDVPLSDAQKIQIAVEAGCSSAASAGCFEDTETVELFGELKTSMECVASVTLAVETLEITPDVVTLFSDIFSCEKFREAFGK